MKLHEGGGSYGRCAHFTSGESAVSTDFGNRFLVILGEGAAGKPSTLAATADCLSTLSAAAKRDEPAIVQVAHAFRTLEATVGTVEAVCRAPVVIFDCAHFEPGIMLLIALRGAARRGVSLLVDAFLPTTGPGFIPYSLQHASFINVLLHPPDCVAQYLMRVVDQSLREHARDTDYYDLPAYEALHRRSRILPEQRDEILVLCPYAHTYREMCWTPSLAPILASAGRLRRLGDHVSARLASDTFHMRLRDHHRCVADWTCLRPDLFYELGVRFASNASAMLHVMADGENWSPSGSEPHVDTRFGRWPCPAGQAAIARHNAGLAHTQDLVNLLRPVRYAISTQRSPFLEDAVHRWISRRGESHDIEVAISGAVASATSGKGAVSCGT